MGVRMGIQMRIRVTLHDSAQKFHQTHFRNFKNKSKFYNFFLKPLASKI